MDSVYYKSPLGILKITADDRFITELLFSEDEDAGLLPEQKAATPLLQQCVTELNDFFNGSSKQFTVPVRQQGTLFQQKVWSELQNIPFGKTASYLHLSRQLGDAKAIRAVASSNAKNKISIIVPCHRIIGNDQSLVGYAWGTWRKQWLLQHEAKWANGVQTLF